MNTKQSNVEMLSTIEEQINLIPTSQYERDAALHYVCIRLLFTAAVKQVCNQVGRLLETGFVTSNPKH